MKCSVYIATSVDGFIAKINGDIDWLHNPEYTKTTINGLSYDDFISTIDAIVMGRNTLEKVLTFDFWPYEDIPVILLTSRPFTTPAKLKGKIRIENLAPSQLVTKLKKEGLNHLYVDGGKTIQNFLKDGLIDEMTITQIPILLGSGIPLFDSMECEYGLRLIAATSSENGFVQARYEID